MEGVAGPFTAEEAPLQASCEKEPSLRQLTSMTICAFPISLIWGTMGMVVLPAEALRLYPDDEAMYLGLMLVVVAFTQLICPVVGQLSDGCRSKWGKRRPYILLGTAVTIVNCVGLWYSSSFMFPKLFFLCLFFSQVGLNIIYIAQASIVPDNFSKGHGSSSGIVAAWQLAGNFVGMVWIALTYQYDYHCSYGFYVGLLSLAAFVICQMNERPTDADAETPLTWQKLLQSFQIDMDADRDFFLVFVGRMLFYIAMSCQVFSFYYFRDMLLIKDEGIIRYRLAGMVILGTFIGMCASYPLGKASDNPLIGRKRLIYFACLLMALVYFGLAVVPIICSPHHGAVVMAVYALGCWYGVGMAAYTSVDYALALDCLPDKAKGSSEALGLWGIAGFVGASAGPFIAAALLQLHGRHGGGYTYQGYTMMFSMGIASFLGCAVVTSRIKKAD